LSSTKKQKVVKLSANVQIGYIYYYKPSKKYTSREHDTIPLNISKSSLSTKLLFTNKNGLKNSNVLDFIVKSVNEKAKISLKILVSCRYYLYACQACWRYRSASAAGSRAPLMPRPTMTRSAPRSSTAARGLLYRWSCVF
jgi:hypothetical protein